jgi:hypothetical protein
MTTQNSQLDVISSLNDQGAKPSCCRWMPVAWGVFGGVALTLVVLTAFFLGRQSANTGNELGADSNPFQWNADHLPPEVLAATGSHGGSNMAVCTGQVGETSEGFFALDFTTGDLKGWVFNPAKGNFGLFMTNVQQQLGPISKNPEYLLVTGQAASAQLGGNMRTGCLIYVVDLRSGVFAAYTAPWDRSIENGNGNQMFPLQVVAFNQIRESMGSGVKKPADKAAPPKKPEPNAKPGDAKPGDANNAANPNPNNNNNNNRPKK